MADNDEQDQIRFALGVMTSALGEWATWAVRVTGCESESGDELREAIEAMPQAALERVAELEAKVATLARMNGNLSDDLEDQHRLAKSWSESSAKFEAQLAKAHARILELERELHGATNRAEMACQQEQCNDCPGCSRADELGGDEFADWEAR